MPAQAEAVIGEAVTTLPHERNPLSLPQDRSDDMDLFVVASDDLLVFQVQSLLEREKSGPRSADLAGTGTADG